MMKKIYGPIKSNKNEKFGNFEIHKKRHILPPLP